MTSISAQASQIPATSSQLDPQLAAMVQSLPAGQQQQAMAQLQAMTPEQQAQLLAQLASTQQQTQAATATTAADAASLGATAAKPPNKVATILRNVAIFGAAGAALGFGASFLTLPVVGHVAAPIAAAIGGGVGVIAGLIKGVTTANREQAEYEAAATQPAAADLQTQIEPQPQATAEPAEPAQAAVAPRAASRPVYVVRRGDNLSVIAARYGLTWQELYRANRKAVGDNPHLIHPGLKLKVSA